MSSIVPTTARSEASSTSDILDLEDDEGWEDAEPEEEQDLIISFIDNKTFSDVASMLAYCQDKVDFLAIRDRYALDFYGSVKLVNFIRSEILAGRSVASTVSKDKFEDDNYLKPVLEDDALLFNLEDLPVRTKGDEPESVPSGKDVDNSTLLLARVAELEEELRRTQSQFADYSDTVKRTLDDRWNEAPASISKGSDDDKRDDDSHYFSSYSYNDIHEVMLKDTVRTDAYRDFIYQHKHLFANKVVLDVGCGTGILSLFCAKAGAARVIAVDNSAIIDKARENIFVNGFSDKIVCLRGKIEDVKLPVDHVDIIVSEWMGYCLLYEAMLDSVIWARDKYLKPDGLMIPSHMNMWFAPVADPDYVADHVAFWRDVYGFDFKAMQAGIHDDALVLHMPTKTICAEPYPFLQLDLHKATVKDLSFEAKWDSVLTQDIDRMDGFIIWFDTFFLPSRDSSVPLDAKAEEWAVSGSGIGNAFTTGPYGKETHWRQGVLLIDHASKAEADQLQKGEKIGGKLEYHVPEDNSRALDVKATWTIESKGATQSQTWKMK